jgi:hypothetical protein
MSLLQLPTEFHLDIISRLDYPSLAKVAFTSKYFEALYMGKVGKDALLDLEKTAALESNYRWQHGYGIDGMYLAEPEVAIRHPEFAHLRLPCYTCLKLRSQRGGFMIKYQFGPCAVGRSSSHRRICKACQEKRHEPGTLKEHDTAKSAIPEGEVEEDDRDGATAATAILVEDEEEGQNNYQGCATVATAIVIDA